MKYLILALMAFSLPLRAERNPEIDKDVEFIIHSMVSMMDDSMDQLISYLADVVLEDSDKTMKIEDITALMRAYMNQPEFACSLCPFFEDLYTPDELKAVRKFYEDKTFLKLQRNSMRQTEAFVRAMEENIKAVIAQYGEPKEVKKGESKVVTITKENFASEVELYEGNVILDVYADWCSPCKKMKPIFDALSLEYSYIKFVKINSDDAQEFVKKYKIKGIPCLIFFKGGKEVDRIVGLTDIENIKAKIDLLFDEEGGAKI